MTRLIVTTIVLLYLCQPDALRAQESAAHALPLALHTLVEESLARSLPVKSANADMDAARAGVEAARSTLFPRLSFVENWQRGNQPVFVFSTLLASQHFAATNFAIDQLNHPDSLGSFHSTAAVEQILFDGGARDAALKAAHARTTIAESAAGETELAIVADVTELYGRVLALQAIRAATMASRDGAREDVALAQRRRDAGTATEADVLSIAVHLADLEQRMIQHDGDLAIVRAQLNRFAGAPLTRVFIAVEPEAAPARSVPSLADVLDEANNHRPEVQRAAAAVTVAEQARRAARSALFPRISAQAAFDVTGTGAFDRAASWLAGAELRWSLGAGGTERARLSEATALSARAVAIADDARAQVQIDALTALRQLESARARQAVGQAMVAQARESQRITRDRYEAGIARVNDVLLAATAVLDAEAQRASALADEFASRARLDRATGHRP